MSAHWTRPKRLAGAEDLYVATKDVVALQTALNAIAGALTVPTQTKHRLCTQLDRMIEERREACSRIIDQIGGGP